MSKKWAIKSTKLPKENGDPINGILKVSKTLHEVKHHLPYASNLSRTSQTDHSVDYLNTKDLGGHSISSSSKSSYISSEVEPLSWKEARSTMREVLKRYMDDKTINAAASVSNGNMASASLPPKIICFWFSHHLDCYLGSILCSIALLVLSVILYIREREKDVITKNSLEVMNLYTSNIIAAVLLIACGIFNAWLLHRRRVTSARGAEMKKRNAVESFILVLDEELHKNDDETQDSAHNFNGQDSELCGTSLTDIYSVYRLSSDGESGQWHKIPSLLLVKGDFIALQLGDTAPADCELVTIGKFGSSALKTLPGAQSKSSRGQMLVKGGDEVPPKKLEPRNVQACDQFFLPGKSKVRNSRKLLHLHSKVYQLQATPIASFLRKKIVPKREPQVLRKIEEVRRVLYSFSMIMLIVSYIVISIRNSVEGLHPPPSLSIPLLAALGSLPVSTPIILILLEIIGTARILVTVHPYASNVSNSTNATILFIQYFLKGLESRINFTNSCTKKSLVNRLVDFPIASSFLYEKLGVVTALTLIDDELACDPISTPQQLLIPTSEGLKLLDLFPSYEDESDDESSGGGSVASSNNDSDSDWGEDEPPHDHRDHRNNMSYRMRKLVNLRRRPKKRNVSSRKIEAAKPPTVNFEDPNWWHYLPSLKCIGLASLLVDNKPKPNESNNANILFKTNAKRTNRSKPGKGYTPGMAENALVKHFCEYYDRSHLRMLAHSMGFTTKPNSFGLNGDISPFEELHRIRIIATRLLHRRMNMDRHQISLEESRSRGLLRPDSTSVIAKDHRTQGYQILTVGDARVVTDICSDSWQGESISPLSAKDRKMILETSNVWSLADLDVTAFSYAPMSNSSGEKFMAQLPRTERQKPVYRHMTHLIDNRTSGDINASFHKESGYEEWFLIKDQMFLGLLGSAISPRRDVATLIEDCTKAGVRFVYFSPRNMRRTKELAAQMGIDVAWNCAISLRPLDEGEEADEHRMKSDYADWDVNARLPHGVEDVKRHLEDVDNVPLLVSLFTDVTRESTSDMLNVFQEYHDTVLSLGLSHISQNDDTFISSDLAFGNDVLFDEVYPKSEEGDILEMTEENPSQTVALFHKELLFVSKIASHSCALNLSLGQSGLLFMAEIIAKGRAALTSGISSGIFLVYAGVALTLTVSSCTLSASTAIPVIPGVGIVLYQLFVQLIALAMAFSSVDESSMTIVPPKNDKNITFNIGEKKRLITHLVICAAIPVAAAHITFLIAFGSLTLDFDLQTVQSLCGIDPAHSSWIYLIRCPNLSSYVGKSSLSASYLMLSELTLCIAAQSTSFLLGNNAILKSNPVMKNPYWLITTLSCIAAMLIFMHFALEAGSLQALPWYLFLIFFSCPVLSVVVCEMVKARDKRFDERAIQFRRLQFETKLGMWSPK